MMTWKVTLTNEEALALGGKVPASGVDRLRIELTVEVDEALLRPLYRAALTNKGGKAKDGPVTVYRGGRRS